MTIHALSKYFHLDWRIVKACEKRYLKHKFREIKLKHVKIIGIDEIAIGHAEAVFYIESSCPVFEADRNSYRIVRKKLQKNDYVALTKTEIWYIIGI